MHSPTADVDIFNALILAVPEMREAYTEKVDFITVRAVSGDAVRAVGMDIRMHHGSLCW